MAVTIVFTVIGLFVVIAMLYPPNWKVFGPTKIGGVFRFGRFVRLLGPGIHHIWLWESAKIDDTRQIQVQIPSTDMSVIGTQNMTFNLDTQVFCHITDPMKRYLKYNGTLTDGIVTLVEGSLTMALNQLRVNPFDSPSGKQRMYDLSNKWLVNAAADWGIQIDRYVFQKVYPPKPVLEKTAVIMRAEGEAKALLVKTAAENTAYQQKKAMQGKDFLPLQTLQTLHDTVADGAVAGGLKTVVIGDDSSKALTQLLNQGDTHEKPD